MDVDELDKRLVDVLVGDGRESIREVAKDADVAATTASKRVQALEDAGVIEGYVPKVNYEALGYEVTVLFQLTVEGDALLEVTERLRNTEQLVDVYEVTGSHDIIAVGKFADMDDMNDQIKDLLTDHKVTSANTSVVLNTVREHERPTFATGEE